MAISGAIGVSAAAIVQMQQLDALRSQHTGVYPVQVACGFQTIASSIPRHSPWPRLDLTRIARMNRYVDWKREKIREKNRIRAKQVAAWMIGTPLAIAIVSVCWRLAAFVIAY